MKYINIIALLAITVSPQCYAEDCIELFGDSLTASLIRNANGDGFCTADNRQLGSSNVSDCVNRGRLNIGGHAPELNRLSGKPVYNFARTDFTTSQMMPVIQAARATRQFHFVLKYQYFSFFRFTRDRVCAYSKIWHFNLPLLCFYRSSIIFL